MKSLKNVYSVLYNSFRVNKVPDPKTSTVVILNKALHCSQKAIQKLPSTPISLFHYNKIKKLALRRLKHEPIEYIAQKFQFRGLTLELEKPVMIPNPGSEELVDLALKLVPETEEHIHFLDVNCGCGALSISFLKERPNAIGVAIDSCLSSLKLTAKNYMRVFGSSEDIDTRLKLFQAEFNQFTEHNVHKFDLIMSSPPCIPSSEWEKLSKEVNITLNRLYENRKSLDGGRYGLDKIWDLIRKSQDCLKKDGFLIIEMDLNQPDYFENYFRENGEVVHGLKLYEVKEDSSMKKRFMILKRKVIPKEKTQSPQSLEI